MWQKIAEEAASTFWRDLGVDLFKTAVKTAVVETVRAQVAIVRDMKLKRKRRALDLIYRSEDDIYRDKREEAKKARGEAEKAKKEQEEKAKEILTPETPEPPAETPEPKEESQAPKKPDAPQVDPEEGEDGTLDFFGATCLDLES